MALDPNFGQGLQGLLAQYNIPWSEYQDWGQITNQYTLDSDQINQIFGIAGYKPNSYFTTPQGVPSFSGSSTGSFAPTNLPTAIWQPGQQVGGQTVYDINGATANDPQLGFTYGQIQDFVNAQLNINTVAALAGYAPNLPGNETNAPINPATGQPANAPTNQASSPAATGGYTPTTNPGINPITGAALGNASGSNQVSGTTPGLNIPANQASNANAIGLMNAGWQTPAAVLTAYENVYGQGLSAVNQYGQAELGQLQNAYLQNSASMQNSLQTSGLGNTTVGQSMQTGLSQSENLALTNLNEQIGAYQTGVIGSLGTGVANAAASLYGVQNSNQQLSANLNSQANLQTQALNNSNQQQQTQIAANAASAQNQFNYATALASQQYGYSSNLLNQSNQYQTYLAELQNTMQENNLTRNATGGYVAGGGPTYHGDA